MDELKSGNKIDKLERTHSCILHHHRFKISVGIAPLDSRLLTMPLK